MTTYKLVWDDFCSIFLEIVKPKFGEKISQKTILEVNNLFIKILSILQPFMPFITSEVLENISRSTKNLDWPKTNKIDIEVIANFEHVNELITKIRNFKKTNSIGFKDSVKLYYENKILDDELKSVLQKLTNCELNQSEINGSVKMNSLMVGKYNYFIDSDKNLSEEDILKIKEDLNYNIGFKNILEKKLSNKKFVDNAPKDVVENEKKKLDDVLSKIISLKNKINNLSS